MAIPPSEQPGLSTPNKFLASGITRALLVALAILGVVAAASYFTTVIYTPGDLPTGWYRLHLRNAAGDPIVGAELAIYAGPNHDRGHFRVDDLIVSQSQGYVEFVRNPDQGPPDTQGWMLFWVYPILPPDDSQVDFEITAAGYQALTFTEDDLFKYVLTSPRSVPQAKAYKYNGTPVYVNLYEMDLTLHETK